MKMKTRALILTIVGLSLLGSGGRHAIAAEEAGPRSSADVFELSRRAYRQVPALEDTLTMVVEVPDALFGERIVRCRLGAGTDAVIEIEGLIRVVAAGDRLYAELEGLQDRYAEAPFDGDLAATLAKFRGKMGLAGLWEPPHVALHAGKELDAVVDSLRLTPLLEKLEIGEYRRLPDGGYEVRLEAANGSCRVGFDADSFLLAEVEYVIRPRKAPEGYEVRVRGRYSPRPLAGEEAGIRFDPGARVAVQTIEELEHPDPGITDPPERILPPEALERRLLSQDQLVEAIRGKRILLIGETHRCAETLVYLTTLLEKLDDKPASLLLELQDASQPAIDRYLRDGDEESFRAVFSRENLPFHHILRWARKNRPGLRRVRAMDESRPEIMVKRVFLTDTRNQTMAEAILREYEADPGARVIAYAGQLHMIMAGRYRYDQPSREPAGSRLLRMGVPRAHIASIMLDGSPRFHLHEVWERPGAVRIDGELARVPFPYFIDSPIFGVRDASELFDYFVNLGPLTPTDTE